MDTTQTAIEILRHRAGDAATSRKSELATVQAELLPAMKKARDLLASLPGILEPAQQLAAAARGLPWGDICGRMPSAVAEACKEITTCANVLTGLKLAVDRYEGLDYEAIKDLNNRRSEIIEIRRLTNPGDIAGLVRRMEVQIKECLQVYAERELITQNQLLEVLDNDGPAIKVDITVLTNLPRS